MSSFLGGAFPTNDLTLLDNLFNFNLLGSGSVQSEVAGLTDFDLNYDSAQNAFVFSGFDPDVISSCLIGICNTQGAGNFGVSLVLSQLVDLSDELGIELSNQTLGLIGFYQQLFGDEFTIATGSLEFAVTTAPETSQSVPEPALVWGCWGLPDSWLSDATRSCRTEKSGQYCPLSQVNV